MRTILILASGVMLSACAAQSSVPPQVSWSYGAGNGDGVQYPGPAPKYSFANGVGKDVPVSSTQGATVVNYGYGADGQSGQMVQMVKPTQPVVAQPTQAPTQGITAPGTHS